MQFITPEIIADARGLSTGSIGLLLAVGLLLWSHGWAWHRFWVVFGITITAGIVGMSTSRTVGGHQVLVAGVLTAVAAGMVAMELVKLLAFATGGTVGWFAFQAVFPQAQELWAAFLCGGLVGVVLFRLWTMVVTSALGVLVAAHAGLVFLQESGKLDSAHWASQNSAALNGAFIIVVLLGVVLQAKLTAPDSDATDALSEQQRQELYGKQRNPKKKTAKSTSETLPESHSNDHGPLRAGSKRSGWRLFPVAKSA